MKKLFLIFIGVFVSASLSFSADYTSSYTGAQIDAVITSVWEDTTNQNVLLGGGDARTNISQTGGGLNGRSNTYLGHDSGPQFASSTGYNNTGVGYIVFQRVTTGNSNTGLGEGTLYAVTTGSNNVAVGTDAMSGYIGGPDITGNGNVFLGATSGYNMTSGAYNVGVGYNSLNKTTTGSNTGVGGFALANVTTASNNAALGYEALKLTTAAGNTAVGSASLTSLTTGEQNVGFGWSAAASTVGGSANLAIGVNSLRQNVSGNSNVAIGNSALYNITGSQNVGIGQFAGQGAGSWAGARNVFIGFYAGAYAAGNDEFYIDNQNRSTNAGEKTTGLIYGNFASTVPAQHIQINGNLKIAEHVNVKNATASPGLSTCGTSPSIATGSNDHAGIVTMGSGSPTACTVTFATAYTNTPSVTITPTYNATAYISAISNTAFTITFSAGAATSGFNYHCIGINE